MIKVIEDTNILLNTVTARAHMKMNTYLLATLCDNLDKCCLYMRRIVVWLYACVCSRVMGDCLFSSTWILRMKQQCIRFVDRYSLNNGTNYRRIIITVVIRENRNDRG